MGAVDGKDLERFSVDISNPARDVGCLAVRGRHDGIPVRSETRFAGRKLLKSPQSDPGVIALVPVARDGREEVTQDRDSEDHSDDSVEHDSDLHEEFTPGQVRGHSHGVSPVDWGEPVYGWPGNCGR